MSQHTMSALLDKRDHHYRQRRRRWVPKGVALLTLLFVVGLASACQSAPAKVTAIAVPARGVVAPSLAPEVAACCIGLAEKSAGYAGTGVRPSLEARLNTF